MSAMLAALGAATLLWPEARPSARVRGFSSTPARGPRSTEQVVGAAALLMIVVVAVALGPAPALAATIVGAAVVRARRTARRSAAQRAGLDALLDGLGVMIAELSVGAHPARACRQAAEDLARGDGSERASVASVVAAMAGRAELGGDVAAGLRGSTIGLDASWERVGVAWRTAEHHGLPMADLLTATRDDLIARRRFAERTRAQLAGARATAAVLALLPVLGIGLGQAMGAGPVAVLLGGGLGSIALVVGTGLAVAGLWWTDRITAKVVTP